MASNDLFLRSDVDKGETSPDKDLRLRSDADKSGPSVPISISSAANQIFQVGQATTLISALTITDDDGTPEITTANDIRVVIPTTFKMAWDTSDLTATITGTGSSKVSSTVSYENFAQRLLITVTENFAAGDAIIVSNISFSNFDSPEVVDNLELLVHGVGGGVDAEDDKTVQIFMSGGNVYNKRHRH